MEDIQEKKYDVLVIGAGAAGMRAAIAASDEGANVCLVSKSLLGLQINRLLLNFLLLALIMYRHLKQHLLHLNPHYLICLFQ